jgi:hypothetical protein
VRVFSFLHAKTDSTRMDSDHVTKARIAFASVGLLCLMLVTGCQKPMTSNTPSPKRDINAVLADHDDRLLAIPGVVGVYVGLLPDEKTPCLKVMLARKDSSLERSIPDTIEGYPVVTEVTGEIKPLDNRSR